MEITGIPKLGREYLSIAVLGRERQGKPRFLDALGAYYGFTRLEQATIGATSVIYHISDMKEREIRAVIHFRKKEKLLEDVSGYLDVIDPEWRDEFELSFEKLGSKSFLSMIDWMVEPREWEKRAYYSRLKAIIEHFRENKELYGREELALSDEDEILEYVASGSQLLAGPDFKAWYKYLAVEKAEIYCPLPCDRMCGEFDKLVLTEPVIGDLDVDIKGVFGRGEETVLDREIEACDAAIVVTMPVSRVNESDLSLYNSLRERFRKKDMSKWLFYLANRRRFPFSIVGSEGNERVVHMFVEEVRRYFSIAFCSAVDYGSYDSIRYEFMEPMLEILSGRKRDTE